MPRWARVGLASVFAAMLLSATVIPAAARESYWLANPIEIRMVGAEGQARDFVVVSPQDRKAAAALLTQLSQDLQAPAEPITETATTRPHYRIGLERRRMTFVPVWPNVPPTNLVYYDGGSASSFLMLDSPAHNEANDGWWVQPLPEVSALLHRHLQGLPPMAASPASVETPTPPWEIGLATVILSGLILALLEDRRQWSGARKRGSASPKGT